MMMMMVAFQKQGRDASLSLLVWTSRLSFIPQVFVRRRKRPQAVQQWLAQGCLSQGLLPGNGIKSSPRVCGLPACFIREAASSGT